VSVESLFVASKNLFGTGIKPGSVFGIAHLFQRQRPANEHQEDDIHKEGLHLQSLTTRTSRSTSPGLRDQVDRLRNVV
jgi:hypothetical protein